MKDFVTTKERLLLNRDSFIKKAAQFIGISLLITFCFTIMTIELENTNGITTTTA
jgi:hypothetical protein